MHAFTLRPAAAADVAACIVLRGLTRENAVSAQTLARYGITEASWSQDVRTGRATGELAENEGRLAGYCFGDTGTGEIVVLALLPEFEGEGMGRALLSRVMRRLQALGHERLFLGCSSDPRHRSHGFYRHLGWRPTGQRDAHGDEVLEWFATPPAPQRDAPTRPNPS